MLVRKLTELTEPAFAGGKDPLISFNPGFVRHRGETRLFYRAQRRYDLSTHLRTVKLDDQFRPEGRPEVITADPISGSITSFEDPRAFVWKDEIHVMHNQACFIDGTWSTSLAIGRYGSGRITGLTVPAYGKNLNRALIETAAPAFEKNWTPLVLGEDLFLIYEINPLTVLKFIPDTGEWQRLDVSGSRNVLPYDSYISGSTPLIPWRGSEYIALFHTYKKDRGRRLYSMGFYTVDVATWRVTGISPQPVLSGWKNRWQDLRYGRKRFVRYDPACQVVFPAGIIDDGTRWLVSFGWNDCLCCIAAWDKTEIANSLMVPPRDGLD